mgnify:CR=1 FL=1
MADANANLGASRVLNGFNKQRQVGQQLKQEQARARSGAEPENALGQFRSLRQAIALDRMKDAAKEKLKTAVATPVKLATSRALQWAWGVAIPSWGLSMLYVNAHVFLHWVFPDLFCKLGAEWQPKIVGEGKHSASSVAGTGFGIAEIIALTVFDVVAIFVVFVMLSSIYYVLDSTMGRIWLWLIG